MGLRGTTRKWVGETGFTSRNAMHYKKQINHPEMSSNIKYHPKGLEKTRLPIYIPPGPYLLIFVDDIGWNLFIYDLCKDG